MMKLGLKDDILFMPVLYTVMHFYIYIEIIKDITEKG